MTWHQLDEALAALSAGVRQARPDLRRHRGASGRSRVRRPRPWPTSHRAFAERARRRTPARTCCSGWRPRAARSRAISRDIGQSADDGALSWRRASRRSKRRRARWRWRWSFGFLLDPDRKLLSIGYLVTEGTLDPSCYDLLASEARLASFVAIAKGDVPARHWFRLGRAVTPVAHGAALISWSGSMFEYLMPSLVMRAPAGSLLEQTNRLIVRRQIAYGASLGLPWGISESAYNARDLELTYQYSNFGVPGLGLKRGLGENAVVAPYATALAAMVDPAAAARNFASARRRRRARPLRLLRGAGLHAEPAAEGRERRDRARLHGASPGHDDRRHRQCAAGRRDARAVPRRADGPGDRTAAAGAHAARRRRGRVPGQRRQSRLPRCSRSERPAAGG